MNKNCINNITALNRYLKKYKLFNDHERENIKIEQIIANINQGPTIRFRCENNQNNLEWESYELIQCDIICKYKSILNIGKSIKKCDTCGKLFWSFRSIHLPCDKDLINELSSLPLEPQNNQPLNFNDNDSNMENYQNC